MAVLFPLSFVTSMSLRVARILAEIRRCSVANLLPPPWDGIPVSVPQEHNRNKRDVKLKKYRILLKRKEQFEENLIWGYIGMRSLR